MTWAVEDRVKVYIYRIYLFADKYYEYKISCNISFVDFRLYV
jgi:hypothetical protein